jgi:hypothetical protein
VRAALRVAQMNAKRRWREAERLAIFWQIVEDQGLQLEQLTTTVRRTLMAQAHEEQKWLDWKDQEAREKSTTDPAPDAAVVDSSWDRGGESAAPGGNGRGRRAHASAFAAGAGRVSKHGP